MHSIVGRIVESTLPWVWYWYTTLFFKRSRRGIASIIGVGGWSKTNFRLCHCAASVRLRCWAEQLLSHERWFIWLAISENPREHEIKLRRRLGSNNFGHGRGARNRTSPWVGFNPRSSAPEAGLAKMMRNVCDVNVFEGNYSNK